jgi:hypothetical protein
MAAKKPSKLATLKEAFEQSDADDDAGVGENTPADKKADKKQFKSFAKKAGPGPQPFPPKKKGSY